MAALTIRLFGKLTICYKDQLIERPDITKALELFCFLALHYDRPYTRDALASQFWEGNSTSQAKKYLRQAIWQLQSLFMAWKDIEPVLLVDDSWVQINPQAELCLDILDLERACQLIDGRRGEDLDADTAATLHNAVKSYRGDLLEGWYYDWCLLERERLQNLYIGLLDKLIAFSIVHQFWDRGLYYGNQILRCDRAHERTYCQLMRLYHAMGDRTGALRQFHRCEDALKNELGVKPSRETIACYESIITDTSEEPHLFSRNLNSSEVRTAPLNAMLGRLHQLSRSLDEIRFQLEKEINIVERSLRKR